MKDLLIYALLGAPVSLVAGLLFAKAFFLLAGG